MIPSQGQCEYSPSFFHVARPLITVLQPQVLTESDHIIPLYSTDILPAAWEVFLCSAASLVSPQPLVSNGITRLASFGDDTCTGGARDGLGGKGTNQRHIPRKTPMGIRLRRHHPCSLPKYPGMLHAFSCQRVILLHPIELDIPRARIFIRRYRISSSINFL